LKNRPKSSPSRFLPKLLHSFYGGKNFVDFLKFTKKLPKANDDPTGETLPNQGTLLGILPWLLRCLHSGIVSAWP
jgi:hypothetical protein